MSQAELLFASYDLSAVLQNQEHKTIQAIESFDPNRLLNTSLEDLADYFDSEYRVELITLLSDQISVDQAEAKVDVSRDQSRIIYDRSGPFYLDGTRITFFVPYVGDKNLLYCRASTVNYNPPRAVVTKTEIQFFYDRLDHNAEAVKSSFDSDFYNLKQHLSWTEKDVNQFNEQLTQKIRQRLDSRRLKILNDQGLVASLGLPLRKREGAPTTYTAPVTRKKINSLLSATSAPYKAEPVLEINEYEQILYIISNMVIA
ncbi:MAG: hypothetical protein M1485_04820 [Chloroflexi bacterium]|nr:hypothetical protein [Chloroflexota bacterium]